MDIGMNLPVMVPGLDRDRVLDWATRIDRGPFASLAAGERVNFPNPEILVTLSFAAAVTSRVRIFFDVLVLPMHASALAAKQVATLDVLSGGRVTLGVGAGAREEDFRAAGASFGQKRVSQLGEQVAELRRAWRGEKIVEGALRPIEPVPIQPGGPPILAGSLWERSIRKVAHWADGITGFSIGPRFDEIERSFELARTAWREAGRAKPPKLMTGFWFALGSDARAQLDRYARLYLNFLGEKVAENVGPTLTITHKAALRDAARRLTDMGCDELCLVPTTLDADELERVVEALA
jgi:alkanesulfonate monooxygenase SsuD/methylene tetrahydromethanopterin reductase-like flavin-dependent oxidoreductase (luciferase family)